MSLVSLAVVVSHPIQHYVPVYRELAKIANIRVKVFFVAENGAFEYFDPQFGRKIKWDVPLTDGYEFEFLSPGRVLSSYGFRAVDSPAISDALKQFNPNFIWINGYAQQVNWRAVIAGLKKAQIIYSADSNIDDSRGFLRKLFKRLLVKQFLQRCDHFLSYGPRNRAYLRHYGVASTHIVDTHFPVDIGRLIEQKLAIDEQAVMQLKASLGIPHAHTILLFAGKLIPHKRPQDVIALIEKLRDQNVTALFVGSGSMESQLKSEAKDKGLLDRIVFAGFVNQAQLAPYFCMSDVFIFPSEKEPYGAIASEVLPFGLPIIAADNVGCVGASIIEGHNGLLYPCADIESLAAQVTLLLSNQPLREKFSKASTDMAWRHDKAVMAASIAGVCEE